MSVLIRNIAIVFGLLLASCSGASSGGDTNSWNDNDLKFVQQMIPHHEQAVEMSEMVEGKNTSQGLTDLSAKIILAQNSEIDLMQGMLDEWGVKFDPHSAHSSDEHMQSGMMSQSEMLELKDSTGTNFERMWLKMMLIHHQGAIEMAESVSGKGKDLKVQSLAKNIISTQQQEIKQIESLLAN